MKVRFSFRTEKGSLPDAVTIMETTRKLHAEINENPSKFWGKYEHWIRPMNQLQNGIFISINWDSADFQYTNYFNGDSRVRLEYQQLGPNFARITFETEDPIPYRIPSGNKNDKMKPSNPLFKIYE